MADQDDSDSPAPHERLERRIDALEGALQRLLAALPGASGLSSAPRLPGAPRLSGAPQLSGAAGQPGAPGLAPSPGAAAASTAAEAGAGAAGAGAGPAGVEAAPPEGDFWVLDGMRERYGDEDVVLYAGTAPAPGGGRLRWQYGLPTAALLDGDFADAAERLSALAHPVRLALAQAVLAGVDTAADLAALPGLGTSGQVYHHLGQLSAAGWLRSPRRGHWEVPGDRVVALLALILIASH